MLQNKVYDVHAGGSNLEVLIDLVATVSGYK